MFWIINYPMKCLKLGFYWNYVPRCAMYSTVRNYLEEATQRSWISTQQLTTETLEQSIIWEIY